MSRNRAERTAEALNKQHATDKYYAQHAGRNRWQVRKRADVAWHGSELIEQ